MKAKQVPISRVRRREIVKVIVGAFNKKKVLVGAISVIVKTDGSFASLVLCDG